jgi:hypothetical protein
VRDYARSSIQNPKHETRNPKSETNSKSQIRMFETFLSGLRWNWQGLGFEILVIGICFGFRDSDFEFHPGHDKAFCKSRATSFADPAGVWVQYEEYPLSVVLSFGFFRAISR